MLRKGVVAALLSFTALRTASALSSLCRPGPSVPAPGLRANDADLTPLLAKLDKAFADLLADSRPSDEDDSESDPDGYHSVTSFSIQLTSETETLWETNHLSPRLGDYKGHTQPTVMTGDSVVRVASVSKVFLVYAMHIAGMNFEDPITKYVPEFLDPENNTAGVEWWESLTLDKLASQMSGVAREPGMLDLGVPDIGIPENPIELGFPPIEETDKPTCMAPTGVVCERQEYLNIVKKREPMYSPGLRATYSNINFALLTLALEKSTGQSFEDYLSEHIFKPLGMNRSTAIQPERSTGIIPDMYNHWDVNVSAMNYGSGGMYTTTNDMAIMLRSMLTNQLIPKAQTNSWFKPRVWGFGPTYAYGRAWEIYRTERLGSDGHAIDLITKAGAMAAYRALIVLVPEYNIGISMAVAGKPAAWVTTQDIMLKTVIPEVDRIARKRMKERYAGTYQAQGLNSSIRLEVLEGKPGLVVTSWVSNNTDFLATYRKVTGVEANSNIFHSLLPVEDGRGGEMWRIMEVPTDAMDPDERPVLDHMCASNIDDQIYGLQPISELVFYGDIEKGMPSVRSSALRVEMFKQPTVGYEYGVHAQEVLSDEL